MITLFLPPPWHVFTLVHVTTGIVGESAHGWGTREDIIQSHIRVRTPAACEAGECFIRCTMPLRQLLSLLILEFMLQSSLEMDQHWNDFMLISYKFVCSASQNIASVGVDALLWVCLCSCAFCRVCVWVLVGVEYVLMCLHLWMCACVLQRRSNENWNHNNLTTLNSSVRMSRTLYIKLPTTICSAKGHI